MSYLWLDKEFQASTRFIVTDLDHVSRLTDEHEEILAAIRDRDPDRAASLVRSHLFGPTLHSMNG